MGRIFVALVPVDRAHVKVEKIEASTWYEARERARSLTRFGDPEVLPEVESAAFLEQKPSAFPGAMHAAQKRLERRHGGKRRKP